MEVKIKQGSEMLDATIEMVDGVMVVSPKEKFEPKDGDVVACEDYGCLELFIFKERIDEIECTCYCYYCEKGNSLCVDNDEYIVSRFATEEEKKKLFDKLAEEGWEWKSDTKELVKLKWKPKEGERYYFPFYSNCFFHSYYADVIKTDFQKALYQKGWMFKTDRECIEFCDRLNDAINSIKS